MISQDLIDGAIDQWSERITMVVQIQGGHIEHRLNRYWTLMNSYIVSNLLGLRYMNWTDGNSILLV